MALMLTSAVFVDKLLEDSSYELEDVIAPNNIKYPQLGITSYYGFSSSTTSLAHAFKHAVSIGMQLHGVTLTFDFDEEIYTAFGLEELPSRKVFCLDKMKSDLGEVVRHHWKTFLMENPEDWEDAIKKGYTDARGALQSQGFSNAVAEKPYLLDKLWSLPEFNHLHIIIYSVLEDGALSNRATIFRRGNLKYDKYGVIPEIQIARYPNIEIDLPSKIQE